jgi:short-subunit dehydrogenase
LVLTGRRGDALDSLAQRFAARSVVADLGDPGDVSRLAEDCAGVDIVVANAALPSSGDVTDYACDEIMRALDVNLYSPIMLARLIAPMMAGRGRGHLVFVGSLSGKVASGGAALYNASKFGLRGFSHGLRQDLRGSGVGVSLVQPGFVRDVGMFADTGAVPPVGARTVSARRVALGVVRAIEHNLGEVNVAPVEMRLMAAIAGQFPELAAVVQRHARSGPAMRQIIEAQRGKR